MFSGIVRIAAASMLAGAAVGLPTFPALMPNGAAVPSCAAFGHIDCVPGGPRNQFGLDWAANGRTWNPTFCALDSDGDGVTNGEELGDPCCQWTTDNTSPPGFRSDNISNPGDATSTASGDLKCPGSDPTEAPAVTEAAAAPVVTEAAPEPAATEATAAPAGPEATGEPAAPEQDDGSEDPEASGEPEAPEQAGAVAEPEPTIKPPNGGCPFGGDASVAKPTAGPPTGGCPFGGEKKDACGSTCEFTFCDESGLESSGKIYDLKGSSSDKAFTKAICRADKGKHIGVVGSTGEAYYQSKDGSKTLLSAWSPSGLEQQFSSSFFKTYSLGNDKYSGVGHEEPQENQGKYLNNKCFVLPITAYEVLDHQTGTVIDNKHPKDSFKACVAFNTKY